MVDDKGRKGWGNIEVEEEGSKQDDDEGEKLVGDKW